MNSKSERVKDIRKGGVMLILTIIVCVFLCLLDILLDRLPTIAIIGFVLTGYYWCAAWYFQTEIRKLEADVLEGVKFKDSSTIISYSKGSGLLKLQNGFHIHSYELEQVAYRKGDSVSYEYMPRSLYILKATIHEDKGSDILTNA